MTPLHYHPADESGWLAVAAAAQLLVVHPSAVAAGIAAYPVALVQGFQATLDELTRGGLSATPSFALLEWSAEDQPVLRVIVRGAVRVTVTDSGSPHILDGAGVSTWTEQSFLAASGFDVSVGGGSGEPWLPLERGAALVTRIVSSGGTPTPVVAAAVGSTAVDRTAGAQPVKDQPVKDQPVKAPPAKAPLARAQAAGRTGTGQAPAEISEVTMVDRPASSALPEQAELDPDARPSDDGYDYLFGETMYRNVAQAAVREPEADAEPGETASSIAEAPAGDHDGQTIMTGDLKRLRGDRKAAKEAKATSAAAAGAGPSLYLELSTGSREPLTQPVLVGRSPTASKVSGGSLPRLVTIPGDRDISRNHAQFAVEGDTVVVTDLHSRNGTQVVMPGKAPQQLRQGEPTVVVVGTVVDLGGGVTLTVCEEI